MELVLSIEFRSLGALNGSKTILERTSIEFLTNIEILRLLGAQARDFGRQIRERPIDAPVGGLGRVCRNEERDLECIRHCDGGDQ